MRLLRSDTFELQEFLDNAMPDYAILSHTWTYSDGQAVDILFKDIDKIAEHLGDRKDLGYQKTERLLRDCSLRRLSIRLA
jgi:hypothetical protein